MELEMDALEIEQLINAMQLSSGINVVQIMKFELILLMSDECQKINPLINKIIHIHNGS